MDGVVEGQAAVGQVVVTPPQAGQVQTQQTPQLQQVVQEQTNVKELLSQESVNSIVRDRVNPLNLKITELNGQLTAAQTETNSYKTQLTELQQKLALTSAGIPLEIDGKPNDKADFAKFKASQLAVGGKTFEDALKEVLLTNDWLVSSAPSVNNVQGSPNVTNVNSSIGVSAVVTGSTGFVPKTVTGDNSDVVNSSLSKRGYKLPR